MAFDNAVKCTLDFELQSVMDIGYELPRELLEMTNTTVQPQFCHICGSFVRLVLIFDDLPASRHEDEGEGESRGSPAF